MSVQLWLVVLAVAVSIAVLLVVPFGLVAYESASARVRAGWTLSPRVLVALTVVFIGGFIGIPLATIAAQAFAAGWDGALAPFSDPTALAAIRLTIVVAAIVVAANTVFGVIAAWTIAKYRFPGKSVLVTAIDLPLTVSPVVAGLAILFTYGARAPMGSWLLAHGFQVAFALPGIVVATSFVTFPYVAREVLAFMTEEGRELEEAALLLGASAWQAFRRVTLPRARWALLNGVLLTNARAMGEFGAVSVVSGHIRGLTNTMPLHVEVLYNDYQFVGAFTVASLLALLAIVTLTLKSLLEWRFADEIAAAHRH